MSARRERLPRGAAAQRRRGAAPAAGRADGQRRPASSCGDEAPAADGARLRRRGACRQRRMRGTAGSRRSRVRPSRSAARALAAPQCPAAAAQHATLLRRCAEAANAARTTLGQLTRCSARRSAQQRHRTPQRKAPRLLRASGGRRHARACRSAAQQLQSMAWEAHLAPAEAAARCSDAARRAVRSMVREQEPESGSASPLGRGWPGRAGGRPPARAAAPVQLFRARPAPQPRSAAGARTLRRSRPLQAPPAAVA